MADLGDMRVKVGADISELLSKVDAAKAKLNQLVESQAALKDKLKELPSTIRAVGKEYDNVTKKLELVNKSTREGRAEYSALIRQQEALGNSYNGLKMELTATKSALATTTAEIKIQTAAVKQAESGHNGFAKGATKVYSGLRKLAYIIPGMGIAGLISLISGPVIEVFSEWFDSINEVSDAMKLMKANQENLSEIHKKAGESIAKETASLSTLYSIATDVSRSMYARVGAVKELQKEFPDYFKSITQENILNGNAKSAYDALTDSLIANALAKAQLGKITDLSVKRADVFSQTTDIIEKRNAQVKALKGPKALPVQGGGAGGVAAPVIQSITQQIADIDAATNKLLNPLQKKLNSFDNQIKKIRDGFNPVALLNGDKSGSKKDPDPTGILAVLDTEIKALEDYKNNLATSAKEIASVNAQIKQIQAERDKLDPTDAKKKKKVETITDVLKKLGIQIDFLNQKELLLKTSQAQAKISAVESAINNLMQKFKLQAKDPIVLKLEAQIQDIKLTEQFKKVLKGDKSPIPIPVDLKPRIETNLTSSFDFERDNLLRKLKGLGISKTKIGIPIGTANVKELTDTLNETLARLQTMGDLVTGVLSPAFDALFSDILSGSQNAFQGFGDALLGVIRQLTVTIAKAAILAGILSLLPGSAQFGTIFKKLAGFSTGGSVKGFATGGFIDGPGTKTSDSIFARLSKGEYIVKADTVSKFGVGFFDKLNRGIMPKFDPFGLPKFATGGFVAPNIIRTAQIPSLSGVAIGGGQTINITGDFQLRNDRLVAAVSRGNAQIRRNS